jgi:Fe-S cluster assembly protein SufB
LLMHGWRNTRNFAPAVLRRNTNVRHRAVEITQGTIDMAALDHGDVKEGVDQETVDAVREVGGAYKYGWSTDIEMDYAPKGLNEDIVRLISSKNEEPEWMTEWRLEAYRRWLTKVEPDWAMVDYPEIDFQDQYYYARPKSMAVKPKSLDEVDPKLLATYEKLGIPLKEQMILAGVEGAEEIDVNAPRKVAVDAVFDSVSVGTTFQDELKKAGVIFCSISEAIRDHPEMIKKYLGSVVPVSDNYYATLNSAVFSDGSFVYVPPGVRCPMELSTYFRINAENTGQFERTLIIADKGSYVSYLEGCTAPQRDISQLHAAVVEIIIEEDAEVKYSTVQNWYPGDENGKGGIYNFVTKRADCRGDRAKVMWTQVETGSAVTWKYPSCILRGDDSQGEFYSIAIANNYQQADTGTKMIHLGKNTKSRIVSKGISAGFAQNTYRGLVSMHPKAKEARNYTQCDSLLIGDKCGAHTVPYIEVRNNSARVEHEATTSKVDDEQLFYCRQRGMDEEEAVALVVNGFCKEVLQALPMEFAMEAQQLVAISLEGSVG